MAGMLKGEAGKAPAFKRPDISKSVPPEQQDAVARIVAAGLKMMYSPAMKDEILAVVKSQEPVPKKMAESIVGMLLMMDQRKPLPIDALPWAAVELLGEAAEILQAAKQPVSGDDFKTACTMAVWLIARKMGATDDEIVSGLEKAGQGAQPTAAPMPAAGVAR